MYIKLAVLTLTILDLGLNAKLKPRVNSSGSVAPQWKMK